MSVQHAQAVEMAHLISRRAGDEQLRQVATDIVLTQQGQIGIMSGWLDTWGLPHTGRAEAMAGMGMPTSGPMRGLACAEEIGSLRTLPAPDAEVLFLQLMIRHHQGGVAMADAAAKMATRPEVVRLAKSMVAAQSYETRVMTNMLRARKAAPDAPLQMGATMPGHAHTPPEGIRPGAPRRSDADAGGARDPRGLVHRDGRNASVAAAALGAETRRGDARRRPLFCFVGSFRGGATVPGRARS
ncbi:MAG: DUF305 domain-containing protein [Armatimonadetes bacterium]|nr:DUF305 domain-containing protein [Armatimonadota bacterium]